MLVRGASPLPQKLKQPLNDGRDRSEKYIIKAFCFHGKLTDKYLVVPNPASNWIGDKNGARVYGHI